jgi:diguanylate cyclase (GGDEF)-like protein
MGTKGTSFNHFMRRMPDAAQLALALAMIAGLTAFKLTVGHSVTVIDFLFIPVVGVGWFARSRVYGYVIAVVAAGSSILVAMAAETQASVTAAVASGIARLILYLVVLAVLGMMRRERAGDQRAAATDQLTATANARAFRATLQAEVARAQRHGSRLSLAYLDIDDFKTINDRLGHAEGDKVLREVSHMLRAAVRSTDVVGRLGGDEFAVLLPETGDAAARHVMDRVLGEIGRLRTSDGGRLSCSVGLVTYTTPPESAQELLEAADRLMYKAKNAGKDRLEQAEHAGSWRPPAAASPGDARAPVAATEAEWFESARSVAPPSEAQDPVPAGAVAPRRRPRATAASGRP